MQSTFECYFVSLQTDHLFKGREEKKILGFQTLPDLEKTFLTTADNVRICKLQGKQIHPKHQRELRGIQRCYAETTKVTTIFAHARDKLR